MGPRFLGRGNILLPGLVACVRIASMGPRFLGRGNPKPVQGEQTCHMVASMGPRFLGRGNARLFARLAGYISRFNGAALFRARKSIIPAPSMPTGAKLQWGRAF